jgi:hypothetical protein
MSSEAVFWKTWLGLPPLSLWTHVSPTRETMN